MARTITVSGMSCEHCEQTVAEALEDVSGVTAAEADHEAGTATVEGDADSEALAGAVADAGYEAEV